MIQKKLTEYSLDELIRKDRFRLLSYVEAGTKKLKLK